MPEKAFEFSRSESAHAPKCDGGDKQAVMPTSVNSIYSLLDFALNVSVLNAKNTLIQFQILFKKLIRKN